MPKDIVVITKKKSTNGVYNAFLPVHEGFTVKADIVLITDLGCLVAMSKGGQALITSLVRKVKVNDKKFTVKVRTLNSVYKLKFKAKEKSELFKKFS